jgi:hypothetical protein
MRTTEIIKEIQRLPLQDRMWVVEKAIHLIRKQENTNQLQNAAEELYADYTSDKELTAFTNIDFEDFYETR